MVLPEVDKILAILFKIWYNSKMMKVRVQKIRETPSPLLFAACASTFLALGTALGGPIEHSLSLPLTPATQTAAVFYSTPGSVETPPEVLGATTPVREPADGVSAGQASNVSTEPSSNERTIELNALINDRDLAIIRITDEIERLKNASVLVVTEFDQNCDNWQDDCALPYRKTLDANDAKYDELAAQLDLVRRSREQAVLDRANI